MNSPNQTIDSSEQKENCPKLLDGVVPIIPTDNGIRRYFVKRDWEIGDYGGKVRPKPKGVKSKGVPCVFRTGEINNHKNFKMAKLTEEWQFFWADLMAMTKYRILFKDLDEDQKADITQAFTGTTGGGVAFTNNNGTDTCNNYVKGITDRGSDPMIAPLICGGDTKCGVPEGDVVRMYSFNESDCPHPPPVTLGLLGDPRVGWATYIYPNKTVTAFPRLGTSVPYPYITVEPYYYPLEDLEEYSFSDCLRSQYDPPRDYYP